jgi:hypothetical protein
VTVLIVLIVVIVACMLRTCAIGYRWGRRRERERQDATR